MSIKPLSARWIKEYMETIAHLMLRMSESDAQVLQEIADKAFDELKSENWRGYMGTRQVASSIVRAADKMVEKRIGKSG